MKFKLQDHREYIGLVNRKFNASSFLQHFDHTHCDLTFLLSNSKYTVNKAIGCTKTPNPVYCNLRPDNVKEILSLIYDQTSSTNFEQQIQMR